MIIKLIVLLLSLATVMGQYMDPAPVRLSPSIIDQSTDRHLVKVYVNDRISAYDSGNIIPTMSRIGEQKDFAISRLSQAPSIWIRDDFLVLSNGAFLAPSSNPRVLDALSDFEAYPVPAGHIYARGQGRVARMQEIEDLKVFAHQNGIIVKESSVYLEGGNVLVTHKDDGSKGILIGMSSLLVSTFLLSLEGIVSLNMNFDAKLTVTKEMIAQELGVKTTQVIYLDQPFFHLDMFLTPGPDGKIFIEDPSLSNRTIFKLLRQPGLSEDTRKGLNDRLYLTPSLNQLQYGLQLTTNELRAAGYQVMGVPGEYRYEGGIDTNFMNGLMGTDRHGRRYYITNQSPISLLNMAFKQVMATYGIDVFFVDTMDLLVNGGGIRCVTIEQIA